MASSSSDSDPPRAPILDHLDDYLTIWTIPPAADYASRSALSIGQPSKLVKVYGWDVLPLPSTPVSREKDQGRGAWRWACCDMHIALVHGELAEVRRRLKAPNPGRIAGGGCGVPGLASGVRRTVCFKQIARLSCVAWRRGCPRCQRYVSPGESSARRRMLAGALARNM